MEADFRSRAGGFGDRDRSAGGARILSHHGRGMFSSTPYPIPCMLVILVLACCGNAQIKDDLTATDPKHISPSKQKKPDCNYDLQPGVDPDNRLILPFIRHVAKDQKHFWTLPGQVRKKDIEGILPVAGGTAALIASDSWLSHQVPNRPDQLSMSKKISDYSLYSLLGADAGAYFLGVISHNDHLRETGYLAGEAAVNATAVTYALKLSAQRQRPFHATGAGSFFNGGESFPSEHSALAWSIASVVAHEYPGPLTKLAAYGLASAVTLTRVTSKQHFASDAVVGSALGWYFGRQVYRAHHDPELGGASWSDSQEDNDAVKEPRPPGKMGSPYVPLDSWVYPALEKLAAFGYIETAFIGLKPWTRMECAQFVEQAGEVVQGTDEPEGDWTDLLSRLQEEFAYESGRLEGERNLMARLESVYTR